VRKPVLQLVDESGTFAFAKLGIDSFTGRLVRAEAQSVQRLGGVAWRTLRVPAVFHAGSWRDRPVLVQEALARGRGVATGSAVALAQDELARFAGTDLAELAGSRYRRALIERIDRLPSSALRETLARSLTELVARFGSTRIEFGASHGDWTPWNMNHHRGRVQVWDWEKFELGLPVGFDAAHCFVQGEVVWGGRQPVDVFAELVADGAALRRAHRYSTVDARLTTWLYVLNLATGYLEDREPDAGSSPLTRLDRWVPRTLHELAARMAAEP
jgi:hypothetical protein